MAPRLILAAVAAAAMTLPALAADMAGPGTMRTGMGMVLADPRGMTLYVFDKDAPGMPACTGDCAHNWPPFMAAAGATATGDWTLVSREGGRQWAYRGHPLYTWSKDAKPGDTTGDGFKGLWHVARP